MSYRSKDELPNPKFGGVYGRYSTHEQDGGSSRESQIAGAHREANGMGGVIIPEQYIFFDEACSGSNTDRPEFMRMLELANQKPPPFQYLFCEDTSRFARNTLDARIYKNYLRKRGIKIIYTTQKFGDDVEGQFVEEVMESVDALHSNLIRRKTVRHMVDNLKAGFSNGGKPPLGLKRAEIIVDAAKGQFRVKWIPDPDTAPVVRKCFELRAKGWGPSAIVREVAYFTKPNGKKITVGDLNYWFRGLADVYAGRMVWNKTSKRGKGGFRSPEEWIIVDGVIEPIVPPSIADEVKRIYADKLIPIRKDRLGKTQTYLGTGKMKCALCGSSMNADKSGQRRSSYYVCYGYRRQRTCSHRSHYRVDLVDNGLLDTLAEYVLTEKTVGDWVREVQNRVETARVSLCEPREITRLEMLRDQVSERLGRLKEAIASGSIPYSILSDKIREEDARHREICGYLEFAKSLKTVELARPSDEDIRQLVENFRGVLDGGDSFQIKRLINDVVEEIRVSQEGKIRIVFDRNSLVKELDYPKEILYNVGTTEFVADTVRAKAGTGPRLGGQGPRKHFRGP